MQDRSFIKKTAAAVLAGSVMAAGGLTGSAAARERKAPYSLSGKTAWELAAQMKLGWNLGNSLEASLDNYTIDMPPKKFVTSWGNPEPTAELFQAVAEGGFNTVRIPVTWYKHFEYDSNAEKYIIDDAWMDYVRQTVDLAYDLGLFVILNVHHEEWVNVPEFTEASLAEASAIMTDIWGQIAETFSGYDQHLIFEALNEPRQTGLGSSIEWGNGDEYSRAYINTLNGLFVDAVRSQGSAENAERLLMLPGYCANNAYEVLSAVDIPENDRHIALSAHAYKPYFFTADTKYDCHSYPGDDPFGRDYEAELVQVFTELERVIKEKAVPVIIGEFGASDFCNADDRARWAASYISKAKAAGIPCVLWDNNHIGDNGGSAYGCLYRLTNTWHTSAIPMIRAMLEVYGVEGRLPEYKEYVPPSFSWDDVPMGDNWVQLYYSENGTVTEPWKSVRIRDWNGYISPDYELVVIYESEKEPFMVLHGDWYKVTSKDRRNGLFAMYFTYDDFAGTAAANGTTIANIKQLYVGASSAQLTVYGVYAVPVKKAVTGDVNADGVFDAADLVTMEKWLMSKPDADLADSAAGDLCKDGVINVFDLVMMRQLIAAK